jgi:uncharacterized protein YdhG (YjbR/CyaY superfamily)
MGGSPRAPKDIDEYIAGFPKDVQAKLLQVRATIRKAAPDAEEGISYAIPVFRQNGNLIYFAGAKNHIGVYPVPKGTKLFQKELAPYRAHNSTVRLPLGRPVPVRLLTRMVKYRLKEQLAKK